MNALRLDDGIVHNVISAINVGIIVIDAQERIVLMNQWFAHHSGLVSERVVGRHFFDIFPDLAEHRIGTAMRQVLRENLPAILSQSLHKAPFPLFGDSQVRGTRLQQAVAITPLVQAERFCLIQVVDVSVAVRREALLREQAQSLRSQSLSDGLTGVGNRRHFDLAIEREFRTSRRSGLPISLLMFDVDSFKAYNDRYGHQQGDECLRRVASALEQRMRRPADMLFRYGGEEFIAILQDTGPEDAIRLAETMRASVFDLAIEHLSAPAIGRVSISIGVATASLGSKADIAELINASDRALYTAKQMGRNRVAARTPG